VEQTAEMRYRPEIGPMS